MTLREAQSEFIKNFAKLVLFLYENGYEATEGEGERTESQQILHYLGYKLALDGVRPPKLIKVASVSNTMNSYHRKKLAHDLNIFKDGKILTEKEEYKPLADFWKSLHPNNISGYEWGWDLGHFQMTYNG